MFGDKFLGAWRLKLMSAFTTGLVTSGTVLSAGEPQEVIKEIKKEIREGGLSYSYEAVEDISSISEFEKLFNESTDPNFKEFTKVLKVLKSILDESGVHDVDGYGSSVFKDKGLYDLDGVIHLKAGNEKSFLWKMIGGSGSEFKTLKLAPENTIQAITFRMDLESAWKLIKEKVPKIEIPGMLESPADSLAGLEEQAKQMGMPIEEITKSMTTEISIVLTMDKTKEMSLPGAPPMPQMAASLIMVKNGDFLQNYLMGALSGAKAVKSAYEGYEVHTVPDMLPTGTKAGMAFNDKILILSSDIESCKSMVAAANGKGLYASSKFSKFSQMPKKGNMAMYLSKESYDVVNEIVKSGPPEAAAATKIWSQLLFNTQSPELYMTLDKRANGIKLDMLSNFNTSSSKMLLMAGVSGIGMSAAMVLPALGKARMKAKQAKSKSRLKQLGTTIAMYYTDGNTAAYPEDFSKFEIDLGILKSPIDDEAFSLQQTIEEKGAYLFLIKPGDSYQGAADRPLAMEKPGLWDDGRVNVVFEDGHVATFFGNTVEEILKAIKARGF